MKIGFVNFENLWGGGEKWHLKMAELFHQDGHDAVICVRNGSELESRGKELKLQTAGFNIYRNSFLNPFKVYKLYKFFKKEMFDVIIMNNPMDLKIGTIAANLAGVKKIVYRRGMPHSIRNTWFNRWLFGKLALLIVISKEIERSIFANNPDIISKDKVLMLFNAINPNDYTPEAKTAGDTIVFGNTGRLVEQKGQHHLIEAAEILKSKGYEFKIKIAGKGPLEEELTCLIKDKNLENEVELTGFIKDLNPFMNSLDVFVFPSYFEGSASSVIEAIYFGKPVIAFDVSTMPEMVKDNYNGYLAEFQNSEMFADKMELFLKNKELIKKIGENAKEDSKQYNLYNVFDKLKRALTGATK